MTANRSRAGGGAGSVRVIAGEARGRRLRVPRGLVVRPTSDRLRGAVFSALGERVRGSTGWDACAGSGAVGIEALSRGALRVAFSEPDRRVREVLRRNLDASGVGGRATLLPLGWEASLARLRAEGWRLDLVYYDPPWPVLAPGRFLAEAAPLLAGLGLILVEHPAASTIDDGGGLVRLRALTAGGASVSFFGHRPSAGEAG
jgi:16S rRNA (guanine(966)-N(2))-methyltransferase RsmD